MGRPLMRALVAKGHEVTVFSRSADRAPRPDGVTTVTGDALVTGQLAAAIEKAQPEVVINQLTNLAQTTSPIALKRGLKRTAQLRREASSTVAVTARAAGVRRVIAQSISFIYRPGPGIRTESDSLWTDAGGQIGDLAQSLATLEANTLDQPDGEGVVLRYGFFYGPGTYFAPDGAFTGMVRRRMLPLAGEGNGMFGFVHLDDAVSATVAALDGPTGVFNVVDDVPAPASEWIPTLASLIGAKPPRRVPVAMLRATAGPHTAYMMAAQPPVSNQRARTELGWAPAFPDWHAGFAAIFDGS